MFKMLSFRVYLIKNKKDIQFVHELLDSPSYIHVSSQKNLSLVRLCAKWEYGQRRISSMITRFLYVYHAADYDLTQHGLLEETL